MKNLLAVALFVSVASIALSQSPSEPNERALVPDKPSRKAEDYQKCEYRVLDMSKRDAKEVETWLNESAKEGYELERVIGDRLGIMRRNFRSERLQWQRGRDGTPIIPAQPSAAGGPTS